VGDDIFNLREKNHKIQKKYMLQMKNKFQQNPKKVKKIKNQLS